MSKKPREFKVGDIVFATINDTMGIVLEIRHTGGKKASESSDWSSILRVKLVTGEERWIGSWDPLIITADENLTQEEMDELKELLNNKDSK